jgi:predicted TIM-barrel fold metal-dependent hydrolase
MSHMKVIDTHVHVWEMDGVLDAMAGTGPFPNAKHMSPTLRACPPRWESVPTESGRVELLIEAMEENGVDGAVVVQTSFSTWDNEYVAAAALRYPDRLRSMGMVDPLDPENVVHTKYWMDERGMSGFRFHPSYYNTGAASDFAPFDRSGQSPVEGEILKLPHNEPMFDAIEARGGIVQLHSPMPEILQVDYAARRWPNITWLLDHMSYPYPAGDVSQGFDVGANHFAGYRPVLDLARHPNVRQIHLARALPVRSISRSRAVLYDSPHCML